MGLELSLYVPSSVSAYLPDVTALHTAWPRLLRRMNANQADADNEEVKALVVASRTWFCLFLFEHQ
jgi:hypothetical protein